MKKKWKAAVIGTGFIGAGSHIPAYLTQEDRCELVAIADPSEASLHYVAKRSGVSKYFTDPQKMLDECSPDVVSVCTPNNFHKQWSVAALRAGANVLCEKPFAVRRTDAQEIYDEARRAGRMVMPCQNDRLGKRAIVKNLIGDGLLGNVYFAELECVRRRGIPNWGAFHMAQSSFGGPFCDVGVHFVDSLLFLLGNPALEAVSGKAWSAIAPQISEEIVNVSGIDRSSTFLPRYYASSEFSVEDHAAGSIRFAKDLLVNFKFSWALNSPEFDGIRLCGTNGGLVFNKYAKNPFQLYTTLGGVLADTVLDISPKNRFEQLQNPGIGLMVEHFLNVLDGREAPIVTEEEAKNVVAVIEAFYRSAQENREIRAEEIS